MNKQTSERMTVEQRDGLFVGVVQSLRGSTWKTVVVVPETAHRTQHAATGATQRVAADVGCHFVLPAFLGERAA